MSGSDGFIKIVRNHASSDHYAILMQVPDQAEVTSSLSHMLGFLTFPWLKVSHKDFIHVLCFRYSSIMF